MEVIELHTPRVNLNANYELYLIITYQYWPINCSKCITLIEDVNEETVSECVEECGTWELSIPFAQFIYKLKTALKIKFIIKTKKYNIIESLSSSSMSFQEYIKSH